MIELELPLPPSMNDYWRPRAGGAPGFRKSRSAKNYDEAVAWIVAGQLPRPPIEVPVQVVLEFTPASPLADIDNVIKPLLDALEVAGVYSNDRLVERLFVYKLPARKPGGVRVKIQPLSPSASWASDANSRDI